MPLSPVKQVPVHPHGRLNKNAKKLKPIHPRKKMKRKVLQIAAEMRKFCLKVSLIFHPKKY